MADDNQPALSRDALSVRDLLVAGMSYMAPGFSFFFTTALIIGAAGVQSPIAYLLAGLGVLATGAAFSEFSRFAPSAGALQVFVQRGFGRTVSTAAGLVLLAGYTCLQAGVLSLAGGWTARLIHSSVGITVPWPILSVLALVLATALMTRGTALSIRATLVLFLIEFVLVALITTVVLVRGGAGGLTADPFSVTHLSNGWSGIAIAMISCVFAFVGFEGAISFAEETPNPRRAVPIAVLGGVVVMAALYVIGTYAAVIGFGTDHLDVLAADSEPIATLASRYAAPLEPLLAFAVFTSIAANLMAAGNANARIMFNLGREGAVSRRFGAVTKSHQTPAVAIVFFMVSTGVLCLLAATKWDYLTAFGSLAGMGALLAILIYMTAAIALPFSIRRSGQRPHPWRHLVIPAVGAAIWLIPLWGSLKPGQTSPASFYPLVALVVIAAAIVYALVVRRRGMPELQTDTRDAPGTAAEAR